MAGGGGIAWGRAATWGAYLACSWTWCIGMFLPILLVRDFGAAGWWAFAIPNVLGAAAMGWVLRSSLSASRLRAEHLAPARAFSLVTVGFHAFFLGWIGGLLVPAAAVPPLVLLGGLAAAAVIVSRAGVRWLALGLWIISCVVLALTLADRPGAIAEELARPGVLPPTDILWLAPVCAFGFALCPYLDLTFLRARRICDGRTGAAAFTIGFGVMFSAMIALTLAYAALLDGAAPGDGSRPAWMVFATIHITLQAAFTIAVHVVELATPEPTGPPRSPGSPRPMRDMPWGRTALLGTMLAAAALGALSPAWPDLGGLVAGEIGYRAFMAFYGLVFPLYVWVCVLPRRRSVVPRRARMAWLCGLALACPMFAAGFLWRETFWLAPGVILAMSARWWVRAERE